MAAAGLLLGLALLWLRAGWLQLVMHEAYEQRAERNQEQRVLIKPARGNLFDRYGRPLARDLPTYSIPAAPAEMQDPRRTARDLARLLHLDRRRLERQFASRPRFLWVARQVPPAPGQEVAGWSRRGLYVSIETRREYPLGAAAGEIIGRTNVDNEGVDGLELQLDGDLRGRPGWATLIRDGRGHSHSLPRGLRRSPEDGRSVVLTLDADLQSILESHLGHVVDTLNAERGFALFMDPRTGEVLASVGVPHLPPGRARNWTITDQYEPGSTFKLVVAATALEEGLATPDQWFEAAANGVGQVAPGAVFHDVHKEPRYRFRDALRWSSNIVMGRLGVLVGDERLYRYATSLGFGSISGIDFPGEASGRLRSPAQWSARSAPTIAIGHEVSVTPLQLVLAYASIANGGLLMQPQLVREVRTAEGEVVRRFTPHASHRVFSERTAALMRALLAAVVDSGTAQAARLPGFHVAGKTGTSQKYDASIGTYARGKYLSSFVGFAPAEDPVLVGLVVIDEPKGGHYYGGEVAAPVFRKVIEDLRRVPHGMFEYDANRVAARPPAPAPVTVPDLRLMVPAAAERRLADHELRARFEGEGARVLAQSPACGVAVGRGSSVTMWLAPPVDSLERCMPDLAGLSVREALRRLTRLELRPQILGSGTVVRQSPAAGTALEPGAGCRLWCEPGVRAVGLAPAQPGIMARNGEP